MNEENQSHICRLVESLLRDFDKSYPVLTKYSRNLTKLAHRGGLQNCYYRESEIEEICINLNRRTRPNVLLVGPAGCGKTAIVEGLTSYLLQKFIDAESMCDFKLVIELDLGRVISGARYRGDMEERVVGLLEEIKSNRDIIVFVDEVHNLMGLGGGENDRGFCVSEALKPALARGEIQMIGATTDHEFTRFVAPDTAFTRRFNRMSIAPIPRMNRPDAAMRLLQDWSQYFRIQVDDDIDRIVLSNILEGPLHDELFPCAFVDVIDRAFAEVRYRQRSSLDLRTLQDAMYKMTGKVIV